MIYGIAENRIVYGDAPTTEFSGQIDKAMSNPPRISIDVYKRLTVQFWTSEPDEFGEAPPVRIPFTKQNLASWRTEIQQSKPNVMETRQLAFMLTKTGDADMPVGDGKRQRASVIER